MKRRVDAATLVAAVVIEIILQEDIKLGKLPFFEFDD
jgi:hypothetical protein